MKQLIKWSEKYALVMALNDPSAHGRPNRMIKLLSSRDYRVDVLSYPAKSEMRVDEHLRIRFARDFWGSLWRRVKTAIVIISSKFVFREKWRNFLNDLRFDLVSIHKKVKKSYDLIIVEDLELLPLAFKIKGGAKVIFDAREYYPRQQEHSWLWRVLERPERLRLCSSYLSRCDHVMTVSPGLANEYKREFGIEASVYRSVPFYFDIEPRKTDPNKIRLVHHGVANPNRQFSRMLEILKLLDDRFSLDMYLMGHHLRAKKEIQSLKKLATQDRRIRICDPIEFSQIVPTLSGYDVGFYYLEPKGFNVTFNLPNKLFEFIQARLAVAIGPSPDMSGIVREYDCGVVASEFSVEAMAKALNDLSAADIDRLKANSSLAAKELCYEQESKKFLRILESNSNHA